MSVCKSCGAEIIWTLTESGKRMPVDAEPALRSAVFLERPADHPVQRAHVGPAHLSHFATVPERRRAVSGRSEFRL